MNVRTWLVTGLSLGLVIVANHDRLAAQNQPPSLLIAEGRVSVSIGMSESAVREELEDAGYELADQGDGWELVVGKDNNVATLDFVQFAGGLLVSATASWRQQGQRDVDLADALYGALASLSRAGGPCEVSAILRPQTAGGDLKSIAIDCSSSGRSVNVLSRRGWPMLPDGVNVQEVIFSRGSTLQRFPR